MQEAWSALAAVAAVVVLFVVLAGGDDDSPTTTTTTQTQAQAGATGARPAQEQAEPSRRHQPSSGSWSWAASRAAASRSSTYKKGDRIQFVVTSDVADEIHVHGYDLKKDVPAGGTVRFSFPARIEGVFEVELEGRKQQIAELRVNPG